MCYGTATVELNEGCFDEQHQQGNKVVPSPPPETLWWQPQTQLRVPKDWSGSTQSFALVKGGLRPLTSHKAIQSTWTSGAGDFTVHVTVDKPGK